MQFMIAVSAVNKPQRDFNNTQQDAKSEGFRFPY
jgi:hypothetical protein